MNSGFLRPLATFHKSIDSDKPKRQKTSNQQCAGRTAADLRRSAAAGLGVRRGVARRATSRLERRRQLWSQSSAMAMTSTAPRLAPCCAYLRENVQVQSTAISSAAQIWRMRSMLRIPTRSTSTAIETLSIESRLTALRRGIGSSPGSRMTSLGRPRIVVVHGAIRARRSRGIATSRDSTTTGRRAISGSSHHQISPLRGVMSRPQPNGTMQDPPTRQARQEDAFRTPRHTQHRSRLLGGEPTTPSARHR